MSKRTAPKSGVYVVRFDLHAPCEIVVGERLGRQSFQRGCYLYIGRDERRLTTRVQRHLGVRPRKKFRWHIDYLADHPAAVPFGAVVLPGDPSRECEVVQTLQDVLKLSVPVPKFGASDCKSKPKCDAHLLCAPTTVGLRRLVRTLGPPAKIF